MSLPIVVVTYADIQPNTAGPRVLLVKTGDLDERKDRRMCPSRIGRSDNADLEGGDW